MLVVSRVRTMGLGQGREREREIDLLFPMQKMDAKTQNGGPHPLVL
jgi:hypothetical protein